MIININGKKIIIRKLLKIHLKKVKELQGFVNSLIKENAQILLNKKYSTQEEKKWLEEKLKSIKHYKSVFLVAEYENKIIGNTGIDLCGGRQNHVGNFGISIKKGYRGMGLGNCLTREIIKLAKKELKPKPKIIKLSVFSTNKPAITLYKEQGFKKVATIPKQIRYKGGLIDEVIMLLYL